jgi:alpha-tubulin suppressor-like RCC1 family protein
MKKLLDFFSSSFALNFTFFFYIFLIQDQANGQSGINSVRSTVGLAETDMSSLSPIPFSQSVISAGIVDMSAFGGWHTCILVKTGRVHCWGSNAYGELGVDDIANHRGDSSGETESLAPVVFAPTITFPVVQVTAGYRMTCGNGS